MCKEDPEVSLKQDTWGCGGLSLPGEVSWPNGDSDAEDRSALGDMEGEHQGHSLRSGIQPCLEPMLGLFSCINQ